MAVLVTAISAFLYQPSNLLPCGKPQVAGASPATISMGGGARRAPALTSRSLRLLPRHLGPRIARGRRRRRGPGQDVVGDPREGTLLHRPVPVRERACCDAECEGLAGLVDRVGAEMRDHPLNCGLVLVRGPGHTIFRSKG